MRKSSLGMLCSYLITEENMKNTNFHDHREILLSLIDCLSKKYKKDSILPVLCQIYNDDINDYTTSAIKKYLETNDIHTYVNTDINSCDAEILIRVIPLVFYLVHHPYIDQEKRYTMIEDVIRLTHTHPVAIISAIIYGTMLFSYIENKNMDEEVEKIFRYIWTRVEYRDWLNDFRIFVHVDRIRKLHIEDISTSTYVIDALTTSLWSVLCSFDYQTGLDKLGSITTNKTLHLLSSALIGAKYGLDSINTESIKDELNLFESIIKRYENS